MRIVGLILAATLAAFGMLASGCLSRSEGQLGHASFSYEECLFGCAVTDGAMAAGGAGALIQAQLDSGFTFSQVRSSNPAVAQFSIGPGGSGLTIGVTSGAPGTTQLQLVGNDGKLVDQVTVTVEHTAKLAVTQGWNGGAPLVLDGSSQIFHVTTESAAGKTLIGTGSVAFDLSSPLHKIGALFVSGDSQPFSGAPGSGTIAAQCDSASTQLPVTIVPLDALTSLSAANHPNSVEGASTFANVDVVANTASGAVYGATCSWSVSDPSVLMQSQVAASLERAPLASTKFLMQRAGSFSATCTIGAVSTTVPLHR